MKASPHRKGHPMSIVDAIEHDTLRRAAFLRHCKSSPRVGSSELDWSENGWPKETLADMINGGIKHGDGSPGWSRAEGPDGKPYFSAEISAGTGFVHVLVDPANGEVAFKSSSGTFLAKDVDEASTALAHNTHQDGARLRSMNPVSNSHWQSKATEAISAMESGTAKFHPARGVEPSIAWEKDFDAVDAHCDRQPDPQAAMEAIRAHYIGGSNAQTASSIRQDLKGGATHKDLAGERARLVAIGAVGNQIRAAIPLKANGAPNPDMPIVAMIGSEGPDGFAMANRFDQPMRFYNLDAFANFVASAQKVDVGNAPGPDVSSRLAARRAAAPSAPAVSTAPIFR
jgi:hypothetical protein